MSNTLAERLRQAAQYTGLDSMRELLIEAAGAMEDAELAGWIDGFGNFELTFKNWMEEEGGWQMLYTAQQPQERKPLTDEQIRKWWASENGLEDCDMCSLTDFTQVVRAIESAHGIKD